MDHGSSSMFHVWLRPMSGNFKEMVRWDFESVVTRRYERRDIVAAIAAFPWTTACSPYTMTFPGAEVMKAGFMGDEDFLASPGTRELDEALAFPPVPLIFVEAMLLFISPDISVVTQGEVLVCATLAI